MAHKPTINDWREAAQKELRDRPLDDLKKKTDGGLAIKPLYTQEDLNSAGNSGTDGCLPGIAPFTRGPRTTMYAGRPWTIRQYAGFSTAEESNAFYR